MGRGSARDKIVDVQPRISGGLLDNNEQQSSISAKSLSPVKGSVAQHVYSSSEPGSRSYLLDMLRDAISAAKRYWASIVTIVRQWAVYLPFSGVIESCKFWREQKRIQSWMDSISLSYEEEMEKAQASKASDDQYDEIRHEHHFQQSWAEDELQRLHHSYYIRLANKLLIPVPPFKEKDGAWMESSIRSGWYLTPAAMHALRAEIRAERKARRDEWLAWIPLLALIVSIISALTALIAVAAS